jgi:MFS family permease
VSRITMGVLADRVGRQNTMIASVSFLHLMEFQTNLRKNIQVLLSGLSVFALWYDAPRSRFISFVVLYGVYAGGYNALLPTTITEIYGVENYASVNGFVYFIRGLGSIFGAPLAGVILGSYKRNGVDGSDTLPRVELEALRKKFNSVVVYDGVLLLSAGFCVGYVRWLDARDKGRWRWRA